MNDTLDNPVVGKLVVATLVLIAITVAALGIYWDKEPAFFNVMDETILASEQLEHPVVTGSASTATLMHIVQVMFDKRGGYLANDVIPPGLFMDNIPRWEYGAMLQVRVLTRVMRDKVGRSGFASSEDEDLAIADTRFRSEHTSWIMPDAQSEYQEGIEHLGKYLERLSDVEDPEAEFDASADNLDDWLGAVQVSLSSVSQRLSASVKQKRISIDHGNGKNDEPFTEADEQMVETPWLEIDDVFYEARGTTWALIHLLKAVEIDFADVLKDKNVQVNMAIIIRELEAAQQELGSPVVLNGSSFGVWANHSLVMASYISRANAAIMDLRQLLKKD